jgi:hypothetical protein
MSEAHFVVGRGVARAAAMRPYQRLADNPLIRPLRVYALDPSRTKSDGAITVLKVPWEPLARGPVGHLFAVDAFDGVQQNAAVDLDDPGILLASGVDPSPADPRFHQQMVYAVAASFYAVWRRALGRVIAWGFDGASSEPLRLTLKPHAPIEAANASYDPSRGEIRFGYFEAPAHVQGRYRPGAPVFTCLNQDILIHELTHALLDGLRSHFTIPTSPDVLGFHEGLADLLAVLQHFSDRESVARELQRQGANLAAATMLTDIARDFGLTTTNSALRSAVDSTGSVVYDPSLPPHELGTVFVTSVFDAFITIFRRKAARFIRIGFPSGAAEGKALSPELAAVLAEEASKIAEQLQRIVIRAIDYCPPVDLELGEFLRALITADRDLVAHDPWCYREAFVDAFAARRIYPPGVSYLSEDALAWCPPTRNMGPVSALSFSNLRFGGDPSLPADENALGEQAEALGRFVTSDGNWEQFGLVSPVAAARQTTDGGSVVADRPVVESIRTASRVGPDGQLLFDTIAEVIQRRRVVDASNGAHAVFLGGSTIVIGPDGDIRYIIGKGVLSERRFERQLAFQRESPMWQLHDGEYRQAAPSLALMHRLSSAVAVEK